MKIENTSDFSIKNAYAMALMSQVAYETEFNIRSKLTNWGFNSCEFIDIDETQCFVAENKECIVIVFRGTELGKLQDWVTDLNYELVQSQDAGCVHAGFDVALNSVWPSIKGCIARTSLKPIVISGHSMGAALAGLCAARLIFRGLDVMAVYNYGQPRICDHTFAELYNRFLKNNTFRIVNNNDIVTRLPPRVMDYYHVGTLQYFTESGVLTNDIGQWGMFLDRMYGRASDVLEWGTDGIKDHAIDIYAERCKIVYESLIEESINCSELRT